MTNNITEITTSSNGDACGYWKFQTVIKNNHITKIFIFLIKNHLKLIYP